MKRLGLFLILCAFIGLPATGLAQTPLVQPEDFQYLGAFRLPEGGERPHTFEYGGNAMTYNPDANTLFVTGHDRMPYGELPDGSRVAEISIPEPIISSDVEALNHADFVQPLSNVAAGAFEGLDEIPRIGLQYLNTSQTGPVIHIAWGAHFQPDEPAPSHGWFSRNLSAPNMVGSWFISGDHPYSVNGYLFEIPSAWAEAYTGGRMLATGRFRDGGWSGMGPALFAYRPWNDDGTPPNYGTTLDAIPLLLYGDSATTPNIERNLNGYQHADEWEGGAWITTSDGRAAVLFAGTKGVGGKFWYGWVNPAGAEVPCVETAFVGEFDVCRLADGTPCPAEDLLGCEPHNDFRGWWSARFEAQFILYNPDDLAEVALGNMAPHEPQPYTSISIDDVLVLNDEVEPDMLGIGPQRVGRIGGAAYDRAGQRLFVLELFADGAQPIVHVWGVN